MNCNNSPCLLEWFLKEPFRIKIESHLGLIQGNLDRVNTKFRRSSNVSKSISLPCVQNDQP